MNPATVGQEPVDGPVPPVELPARGLGRNLSALATSQAITWTVTLLWTVVVPRAIGPGPMGLLTIGTSTAAIIGVVLGLPTREFVAREMVADPARRANLLGSALVARLCLTPVFLLLLLAYVRFADLGRTGDLVVLLSAVSALTYMCSEPGLSVFQATERMQYLAYAEVLNKTLASFGGIALALLGFGVVAIAGFTAAAGVLLLVLTVVWARQLAGLDLSVTFRGLRELAAASLPYWITGIFFMVYLWIDAVMLGLLVPAEVVGWYGAATKLFTTLMFVPVLLATAWLPRLVRAYVEGGEEQLTAAARVPVESIIVLSLPVAVGAVLAADGGVRLLYGDGFAGAADVLAVLGLCVPPMYLSIQLNQVLIAAGRPGVWAWVLGGATFLNIGLNSLLIPALQDRSGNGATGAALALLLTELAVVTAGMVLVGRRVLPAASLWRLGRAVAAAAVMAGVMAVAAGWGVLVQAPLGLLAFAGAAVVLRVVTPDQRQALTAALRARRSSAP